MTRTGGLQNDTKRVEQKLPDARNHQKISFIKSGIRILGWISIGLMFTSLWSSYFDTLFYTGVTLNIIAELIGVYEELV
jgi:hypothetical protein